MHTSLPAVPSTEEIIGLIDDLTAEYLIGGPRHDTFIDGVLVENSVGWDANEAHYIIIKRLSRGDDDDALELALCDGNIETAAAMRDLLRLVGSRAAAAALSWVLGRGYPLEIGFSPTPERGGRPDRADVLREARGLLPEWEARVAASL